jgi:MraZ protein
MAQRLNHQLGEMQMLGRLLSTRHRAVQLAGRGRLLIPEGFREFLGVEAGGEVMIVGAAVCIEIWDLQAWLACLREEIPRFGQLLQDLGG